MKRGFAIVLLTGLVIGLTVGCGPKVVKEESVLDTADHHYSQGMREYERGQYATAVEEFQRALSLNPDYAEGYAGLALVWAAKGSFDKAHEYVAKALDKNGKSLEGRVAKGRILVMERKGQDWLEKAIKEYDQAAKINPYSPKPLYFKGEAYKAGYQFAEAAAAYSRVIALKGEYAAEADQAWATVQKVQRAAPGTKLGARIVMIDEIDRADVAVLFVEELKLLELIDKKTGRTFDTGFKAPGDPSSPQTSEILQTGAVLDVATHWAKNWIIDIVQAHGMEVFPDHTFRPDEKITRADYAMLLQNILILANGDENLATKYIGSVSRFPDVNASHYAYNAVCLMVDRGIMQADKLSGAFHLNDPVSGADALLIIRDLQNALKMAF